MRYWHEIKKVPIDSVDDSASRYGVRDWVRWGRSRARGGDMDSVLNYLDNIVVNPLVMMDNPPGLALHDVSGSAASSGNTDVNPLVMMYNPPIDDDDL